MNKASSKYEVLGSKYVQVLLGAHSNIAPLACSIVTDFSLVNLVPSTSYLVLPPQPKGVSV